MTELRNTEQDLSRFRLRVAAAALSVLFAFGLLVARLSYLQIGKHDELSVQAENNRIAVVPITPNRGLILDRNGVVLANNYSAYTLEIAPAKVADLDATIDALSKVVTIEPRDRKRFKRIVEESRSLESVPIRTKLTDEEVARFTAQRFRFEGVEIKARLFRSYPLGEVGSHLIGYIGRINPGEKEAMEDNWSEDDLANYRGTDYIGKLGVEQSYESELHGSTGFEEVEMSASGRAVRRLKASPATPGNALVMSIDIRLQALVEELFGDRRGALVAIDPRNGEILAFVSKPNFDPNLFVDGIDVDNWKALNESPDKPLLNRALRGTYPPGSTYKPFMALAALTLGKRTPQQTTFDPGYYNFGGHKFRDDKEGGHGTVDMYKSIVESCDTYYYTLANDLGVDAIHDFMAPIGFGQITGIDVQGELRGTLPSTEWKRNAYKKKEAQKWYAGETISLGIGQGYNTFTMLQLAQAEATMAARRAALHAAPRARGRELRDPRRSARLSGRCRPRLEARARRDHPQRALRRDAGRHLRAGCSSARRTSRPARPARRRSSRSRRTRSTTPARSTSATATTRSTPRSRRSSAADRDRAGGRERRLGRRRRRADRAARVRLRATGKYPSEADIAATQQGLSTVPIGVPRNAADVRSKARRSTGRAALRRRVAPAARGVRGARAPKPMRPHAQRAAPAHECGLRQALALAADRPMCAASTSRWCSRSRCSPRSA